MLPGSARAPCYTPCASTPPGRACWKIHRAGSELERDFGFGVVRQWLETRLVRASESERTELLAGAAALAGPVLGLGGGVGDSFAVLHGLYWLVANSAVGGPVVLACDDLQWADEPSLRWLAYLCQRLEGLPVLVAATTRLPRPGHSPLLTELLAVGGAHGCCVLVRSASRGGPADLCWFGRPARLLTVVSDDDVGVAVRH